MLISSSNSDRKSQTDKKRTFLRKENNLNFHSVLYIVENWSMSEVLKKYYFKNLGFSVLKYNN